MTYSADLATTLGRTGHRADRASSGGPSSKWAPKTPIKGPAGPFVRGDNRPKRAERGKRAESAASSNKSYVVLRRL